MAIYKATQELTQTVVQTYWEEFDTESQEQWDLLKSRVADAGEELDDDLPEDAPSDPTVWFELYKKLYYAEYQNQDDDDWVSDRKGFTEYSYSIEDADGELIASE